MWQICLNIEKAIIQNSVICLDLKVDLDYIINGTVFMD